ncbi:uncharacterized protein LOC135386465 [Ornithodoros turicata]|uniref:uncharacterized protein LOC135386465 n=1 Tax=Ornithodoros turicata TaxID=34597 RepID=UPI00313A2425
MSHANAVPSEALEVPEVCSVTTQPLDILALDKLRDLGLAAADAPLPDSVADAHISVLIGSDIYWTLVSGNIRRLTPGLTAVETRFGWLVQGAYPVSASACTAVTTALSFAGPPCESDIDPAEMWRLDAIGITDDPSDPMHLHPALDEFEHQVAKIGNRYQVPLLIKDSYFGELADNRTIAEARLLSQLRRLRDQPHLLQQYHDTISEYFSEGHAEEVPNMSSRPSNLYYLPHHAVIRQDAVTTKVRVVFDASSHMPGELSLNQVLHKGPNLNADLLVQLIAFRCHPVVLIADIRKAYLQIAIRPEDRDALRFLWIKKLPSPQEPLPDIQEWRMTRVPFGASSSPFLLAATLRHHLAGAADRYPDTTERLKHGFYVDDLIVGATSDDDAFRLYQDAVSILAEAGMELRKWASNSPTMNSQFLHDGLAYDNVSTQPMIKVLGLLWHRPTDEITFDVGSVVVYIADHPVTKRTILHALARIFDPLGYLTPFTISARLLFQSLWSLGYGWDAPLAPQQRSGWTEWCSQLPTLNTIRLARHLTAVCDLANSSGELHVFADASPRAYGARYTFERSPPKASGTAVFSSAKAGWLRSRPSPFHALNSSDASPPQGSPLTSGNFRCSHLYPLIFGPIPQ